MTLVDTSAWVEYLRDRDSEVSDAVARLLETPDVTFTTDVVRMELLAGARSEAHARSLSRLLDRVRFVPTRPLFDFDAAATIYRTCRRGGMTPRSHIDCLVAAVAVANSLPILQCDRDFPGIARFVPLTLA